MNLHPLHWYLCFERRHPHAQPFFQRQLGYHQVLCQAESSSNVDVCFKETEKCKNFDRLLFVIHCDTLWYQQIKKCALGQPLEAAGCEPCFLGWFLGGEPRPDVDTWKNQADIVGIHFGSASELGLGLQPIFMFIHVYSCLFHKVRQVGVRRRTSSLIHCSKELLDCRQPNAFCILDKRT